MHKPLDKFKIICYIWVERRLKMRYTFKNTQDNSIKVSYGNSEVEARARLNNPRYYRLMRVRDCNKYCEQNYKNTLTIAL